MPDESMAPPNFFRIACGVLNGELRIPQKPRPKDTPPLGKWRGILARQRQEPPVSGLSALYYRGPDRAVLVRGEASTATRQALAATLALDGLTQNDVLDLADYLRTYLRYRVKSPVGKKPYADCVLPAVREQWSPPPSADDEAAAWERVAPRLQAFGDFLTRTVDWFGWESTSSFFALLGAPAKTLEDTCVCLLAASVLPQLRALAFPVHERILPCLACPRFFVATRPNAETCSARCRQRLYRGSQDEKGREHLRDKAREHKRTQRQRERETQAGTHSRRQMPTAAKPSRRGSTSRRSR